MKVALPFVSQTQEMNQAALFASLDFITKPILERYQQWLAHKRKWDGSLLHSRTQYGRIVPIKMLFRWMTRKNYILYNPASELEMPRYHHRLPRAFLTVKEVETVLMQPDTTHPLGLRDRAIMETLYSTGIRRMEVIALAVSDVDHERGTLMVREGKGKKDRLVPIGERALMWIEKYLNEVRPTLVRNPHEQTLFLTHWGESITDNNVTSIMRRYIEAAQIGKKGSCHIFRHTFATLMLENGADIRHIQAMLGHADLSSTEIYTHVAIQKLKLIHTEAHPASAKATAGKPAAKLKPFGSAPPFVKTSEDRQDKSDDETESEKEAVIETEEQKQERAALLKKLYEVGAHVRIKDES